MKKLLTIAACALMTIGAHAQGSLNFANLAGSLNAPVTDMNGDPVAAGDRYQVMLWAGADANSLSAALASPVGIAVDGYFVGEQQVLGFPAGSTPFVQARVWDTTTGADWASAAVHGESNIFQMTEPLVTFQGTTPPPNLVGLQSFQLVPEPSTVALGALGAVALAFLSRRRK